MKKIAVFGKPASGKSTLSKKLAFATNIKLYPLDAILYTANGEEISRDSYDAAHKRIISSPEWIIEGFAPMNCLNSFDDRIEAADTIIYIDLPYVVSYWLVTKRLLKSLYVKPEGWPEGSSVLKGTLTSYKVLRHCPKFWNDDFLVRLQKLAKNKSLYVIHSIAELNNFVAKNV